MNYAGYDYIPEGQEQKESHFRTKFLISAVAVLCTVLLIAVVFLINSEMKHQKYVTALNAGNQYYNAGDYQNAIVQYQIAIAANNKDANVYLNMSSAYMNLGDYASANAIISQGLSVINADVLLERQAFLQTLSNTEFQAATQLLSAEKIADISTGITLENTTFDMVAAYTYTDYYRDFGNAYSASVNGGQVSLFYEGMSFTAVYYNTDKEIVLNSEGTFPLASVKPCYVSFNSVTSLFSGSGESFAVSRDRLKELFGKEITVEWDEAAERNYVSVKYKKCMLYVETDADGNIVSENAWNKLEPLNRKGMEDEMGAEGEVQGYVQDAVTGRGMVATIKVRNRGSRNGNVLAELISSGDGSYTFGGEQGTYTLEVSAAGYTTEYIDVEIIRGQVKTGKNVVLSPVVEEGEIRVVLSWGSTPTDLDSHAEGRSSSGNSFHISYMNKRVENIGTLDVDDRNGYGPETITITDAGSSFTYSVEDFTGSGTMSSSGATVKVYLPGNASAITYTVPDGAGNTWEVFSFENGQVTEINTIY